MEKLPKAARVNVSALRLPKIERTRHKYQAGYVVGFGGSSDLSGAVKLAGLAALRAGAGIVRIFCREEIGPAPLELICNRWSGKAWKEELKRASSVFIGPGLGQTPQMLRWLKGNLKEIEPPCVIDADALLPGIEYPERAILTPHHGEALRLLGLKGQIAEEALFEKIERLSAKKKLIVVLKGAPTFVFLPSRAPVTVPHGDPGMATAGSGDVLTGVLAALLAQKMEPGEAAILGAVLHGMAGEAAAAVKTSYCLIASDLIDFLPHAFKRFETGSLS